MEKEYIFYSDCLERTQALFLTHYFFLLVLILIRLYQDPMDVETWVERERIITKNLFLETKL